MVKYTKRDFIFTEDAAEAVLKILDTDFTGIVNLGSGKMSSLKLISEIIEDLSGKKIISKNQPVSGPMEFNTNIKRISMNLLAGNLNLISKKV